MPTKVEVKSNIRLLRRGKAAGSNELLTVLSTLTGEALTKELTTFHCDRSVSADTCGKFNIAPIIKNRRRNDCNNHRGINLLPVVTNILALITMNRVQSIRETNVREKQPRIPPRSRLH